MASATARTWGLAGLFLFEVFVVAYTWGVPIYTLTYGAGALLLAFALWQDTRGEAPNRIVFALLALVALVRAGMQTIPNGFPAANMPSYLVALGFGLIAWRRVSPAGIALVALARTWFIYWYFTTGANLLVVANIVGAAGAWLWFAGEQKQAS